MQSGYQLDGTFLCAPCKRFYPTWERLIQHKGRMRAAGEQNHIHCKECGEDFQTERHPQAQNIHCPGCGKGPFVRIGGLMSHIQADCPAIENETIEAQREEKMEFSRNLQAATQQPIKSNYEQYMPPASTTSGSNWDAESKASSFVLEKDRFPGLRAPNTGGQASKENKPPSSWSSGKNLFPDAPAAQRPTQQQLRSATAPSARTTYDLMSIDNPSHPNFNSGRYYCAFTDKFNCPINRCGKSFKKGIGLVSHLKSEAHSEERYRCPYCLNTFGSLVSITQHVESNGSRCQIRNTDQVGSFLDSLTGGMLEVSKDTHEDGTVKYEVSKNLRLAQGQGQDMPKVSPKAAGGDSYKDADIQW
ncbi:hypothetical protein F66182_3911 [Fusarium sp. NRRL 66182]|nr:hypothetical protein F66182_3911 [Fusarium sp. NRRL 66182]